MPNKFRAIDYCLVLNATLMALIYAAWQNNWVQYVFEKDTTFISHVTAIIGIIGVIISAHKAWALNSKSMGKLLSQTKTLEVTLMQNISIIELLSTVTLTLGILGTVVGLIIGFSSVNPGDISNIELAGPTVAKLLKGMSIAFHTTLVGGVCSLWLQLNHYLLKHHSITLYSSITE